MQRIYLIIVGLPLLLQFACSRDTELTDIRRIRNMKASEFSENAVQQRLAEAVERDSDADIDEAIRQGADANALGPDGIPLLAWALTKQRLRAFERLLAHGADLSRRVGNTPLSGEAEQPEKVIEWVIRCPDTAFLKAALESGVDPNTIVDPNRNQTLLFNAIWAHSEPATSMLLDYGANPDQSNNEQITPLAQAHILRDMKLAHLLMSRGADPTIKNKWGYDLPGMLKKYGSRCVWPGQREYFDKVVEELVKRGLLTHQDIIEADKPKPVPPGFEGNPPGITVIEHSPDSEAGRAILELDRLEREANERDRGTR